MIYVLAVLLFILSIVVHEFGHFIVAKKSGVDVKVFSIGFGPKLIGFTKNGTEYRLSAIPLGGYVKLYGDDLEKIHEIPEHLRDKAFFTTKPYKKIAIVVAGALMNFVFMYVLLTMAFLTPREEYINQFEYKGHVATLLSVDDMEVVSYNDLSRQVSIKGDNVKFTFKDGDKVLYGIFLKDANKDTITIDGRDYIVFKDLPPYIDKKVTVRHSLISSIYYAFNYGNSMYGLYLNTLKHFKKEYLGGPIGISVSIKQFADKGLFQLFVIMAILNLSLGVFNLLPIPVLDGGYLLTFVLEWVSGRIFSPLYYKITAGLGLAILLSLFVYATYNDIIRFVLKG